MAVENGCDVAGVKIGDLKQHIIANFVLALPFLSSYLFLEGVKIIGA